MPSPRALIAEDEPVLREELVELLGRLWPDLEIAAQAGDGVAALSALEQARPDLMFLDIQMPGMSGLEVARQAAGRCHIVFITAYDQYAVAAFDEGAVDYVLKPVTAGRLATAVSRLKEKLAAPPRDLSRLISQLGGNNGPRAHLRWINASRGKAVRLITVEDIAYFKADNKYTLVVTAEGESVIRKSIKELLEELDPDSFWQIHRSTVVNVNAIDSVLREINGHVQVRLKNRKELLPVSETYTHLFRSM
ncbi:MAG TPA: LytTR family DNA-binding domain-containing protein [Usitatibacter sp.]|nr:LytTR family DNA-binding domain-containing protein [Usitatibacter sp.]